MICRLSIVLFGTGMCVTIMYETIAKTDVFSHALTYLEMILRAKVFIDNNKLIARVSLIITGASAREGQGGPSPPQK